MEEMEEPNPAPAVNPLNIFEILTHVLVYVGGTNTRDLLPCRLVNHNWNTIVTELLKKERVAVVLYGGHKLASYLSSLNKCQSLRTPSSQPPLDHLNLVVQVPNYTHEPFSKWYQHLVGNVAQLVGDPHNAHCKGCMILTVYLEPKRQPDKMTQIDWIHEIQNMTSENFGILTTNPTVTTCFPKLQSIEYNVHNWCILEPSNPTIFNYIIQSAPSLQSLIIPEHSHPDLLRFATDDEDVLWSNQRSYVTEIIHGLVETNNKSGLRLLSHLELPIYNQDSLHTLTQLVLPQLKSLKLHQKVICLLYNPFNTFLSKNCQILESLELVFLPHFKYPINFLGDFDPSTLHQITQVCHVGLYFGLSSEDDETRQFAPSVNEYKSTLISSAAIISAHFPSLTSVSMDVLGLASCTNALKYWDIKPIAICLSSNLQPYYANIRFVHVVDMKVVLHVSQDLTSLVEPGNDNVAELNESIANYVGRMCPSLTKLTVNSNGNDHGLADDDKIPESNLGGILKIHGITSLEILNSYQWLSDLIKGKRIDDDTCNILRANLCHLKFGGIPPKIKQAHKEFDSCQVQPSFLKAILAYFSNLEYVQTGTRRLRSINEKLNEWDWD